MSNENTEQPEKPEHGRGESLYVQHTDEFPYLPITMIEPEETISANQLGYRTEQCDQGHTYSRLYEANGVEEDDSCIHCLRQRLVRAEADKAILIEQGVAALEELEGLHEKAAIVDRITVPQAQQSLAFLKSLLQLTGNEILDKQKQIVRYYDLCDKDKVPDADNADAFLYLNTYKDELRLHKSRRTYVTNLMKAVKALARRSQPPAA